MKTAWVACAILLALALQTAMPLTRIPLLQDTDFFTIIVVLFVCRLPERPAYPACAAAGLFKGVVSCLPFGLTGLLGLLVCAILLRLKARLIVEHAGCRLLLLVVAVWVEEIGALLLLKLLCGLDAPLPLSLLLKESLVVGAFGSLVLSYVAFYVRRRRMKFAAL